MKHVTAPFSNSLGTTTSNFKPQHSLVGKFTLMLLFLLISQAGIVAQTCTAPMSADTSFTFPNNCTTIPTTFSGQSGNVFELTINPANAYTFKFCFAPNSGNSFQFPQAELYNDTLATSTSFITETGNNADGNNCTTLSYTPAANCAMMDGNVYLALYSHQCVEDWRDIDIEVTCQGCEIICGTPRFVAATNSGCSANAFTVDAPMVTGSCAGNTVTPMASTDLMPFTTPNADGSVSVATGAPVGTHTITFAVDDCAGITTTCDQIIVIEPVLACDDVVNVTLSQFCQLQVTPGMLLEAECAVDSQYTVNILGQTDDIITEPGMYEVQIMYTPPMANSASGNFCWGFINAEDKSGPTCTLEDEFINVSCGEDFDAGTPVYDDCSGVADSSVVTVVYGNCGITFPFQATANTTIPAPDSNDPAVMEFVAANFMVDNVIVNFYSATDTNGKTSNACEQFIYVWRPSTVTAPSPSITVECGTDISLDSLASINPVFVPYYDNPKYGVDTDPTNDLINGTDTTRVDNDGDLQFLPITDVDHNVCRFTVSSSTTSLQETCGSTEKFIRRFTVLNWCTGNLLFADFPQIIKTEDTIAPEFDDCVEADEVGGSFENPLPLFTSSAVPGVCDFTGLLIAPVASDDCSEPISYSANIFTSGGTGTGYILVSQVPDLSVEVSLSQRDYRIDFFATDDCNNQSDTCSVFYDVIDDDAPVAICDQFTTVSLTNVDNGTATVCADNLDSGSYDNCGITSRMIKRMGTDDDTFANCLDLVCADAGLEVMVVLRVVDAAGNSNICMVTVEVQDKVGAQIVCPADVTVSCLNPTDISTTGDVIMNASALDGINGFAFDNCNINAVNNAEISNTVDCGQGVIEREFTAFTSTGVASCVQTITVEPDFNYFVSFPADVTITGCADVANIDMVGEPIISGVTCGEIGIAIEDQTFVISSGACNRIHRTYFVKNTCIDNFTNTTDGGIPVAGDPLKFQDDGDGFFKYTQKIDVVDEEAPVFVVCENQFFDTFSGDCSGNVLVDISATDNCSNDLTYFWKVDLFSDGSDNEFGNDSSIEGVFPVGEHTAFAQTFDGCGNTETCSFLITVIDVKNPTPFCTDLGTVIMNGDSRSITIWANDLIQQGSSFDNCTANEDIIVTASLAINPNPTSPSSATSVTITCDDLIRDADGNALPTNFTIQVFVTDEAGNWDFCTSQLNVIDTGNDCGDSAAASSAEISGRIFNEQNEDVEDVTVEVESNNMNMNPFFTDVDGQFAFNNLVVNGDYSVEPSKVIDPANGVTTYDLVLLTRHILGITPLNSPYKIIAADVNEDKTLNILDLIEVRQLILYSIDEFSSLKSWSFIDADYQFNNSLNPLSEVYPEIIGFNQLASNAAADFIGVKLGDLDGDSYANRLLDVSPRSLYPTAHLIVNDAPIASGEIVKIPFSSEDLGQISAMQFSIDFDQNTLEFAGVNPGALTVSEGNFGTTMLNDGILTFSWNTDSAEEVSTKSDALFTLEFTAKRAGTIADAISLSTKYTPSIAYNNEGQQNVELNLNSENGTVQNGNGFELFQNQPNPFLNNTVIGFNLPEATTATLSIMDVSGKELKVITNDYVKGYNKIDLDVNSLDVKGVLFYQLETASHSATMKMIVIE